MRLDMIISVFSIWTGLTAIVPCQVSQRDPAREWVIRAVTLAPEGEQQPKVMNATIWDKTHNETVELAADVSIINILESFVWKDRLVIFGDAGRTQEVVIFDLLARQKIEGYFCYAPVRVSDSWIIYVEFYYSSTRWPTDVLLAYDLAKSPIDNRLGKAPNLRISPDKTEYPTRVGMPIYPDSNVKQKSFTNQISDRKDERYILGSPFLLLPSKRLVFIVGEEYGYLNYACNKRLDDSLS